MKAPKFLLAAIILIAVNISACKKDSSEHSDITGKWNLAYVKASLTNSEGILDTLTINSTSENNIELRADGKIYSSIGISISFNSEHELSFTNVQSTDTGYYQIVNNKIIVTNKTGEKDTLKIIQLDNNQLVLDWSVKIIKDSTPIDYSNYILWSNQFYYIK